MAFAEAKATVRTSTSRAGSCVSIRWIKSRIARTSPGEPLTNTPFDRESATTRTEFGRRRFASSTYKSSSRSAMFSAVSPSTAINATSRFFSN